MKLAIRRYCDEDHDILSAKDMTKALLEGPASGVTASVNKIDESKMSAEVKPMKNFYSFPEFSLIFPEFSLIIVIQFAVPQDV